MTKLKKSPKSAAPASKVTKSEKKLKTPKKSPEKMKASTKTSSGITKVKTMTKDKSSKAASEVEKVSKVQKKKQTSKKVDDVKKNSPKIVTGNKKMQGDSKKRKRPSEETKANGEKESPAKRRKIGNSFKGVAFKIPKTITKMDLSEHFSQFGKANFVMNSKNRPICYVFYEKEADLDKAVSMEHIVKGEPVCFSKSDAHTFELLKESSKKLNNETKIFVRLQHPNDDVSLTKEDLKNHFSKFGVNNIMLPGQLRKNKNGIKRITYGFVIFKEVSAMEKVLKQKHQIRKIVLHCSKATGEVKSEEQKVNQKKKAANAHDEQSEEESEDEESAEESEEDDMEE